MWKAKWTWATLLYLIPRYLAFPAVGVIIRCESIRAASVREHKC